jgi:hypothetical protein
MPSRGGREAGVLLDPAGDSNDGTPIAQMAADLALDAARDVPRQGCRPFRVASVDRTDHGDRADLHQILEPLAAAGEASGYPPNERKVVFDQPAPRGGSEPLICRTGRRIAGVPHHLEPSIRRFRRKINQLFSENVLRSYPAGMSDTK